MLVQKSKQYVKLSRCFLFAHMVHCKLKCSAFFINTNQVNCLAHVWNESKTFYWNIIHGSKSFWREKIKTLKRNCLHWLFFSNTCLKFFFWNALFFTLWIISFFPSKCYSDRGTASIANSSFVQVKIDTAEFIGNKLFCNDNHRKLWTGIV